MRKILIAVLWIALSIGNTGFCVAGTEGMLPGSGCYMHRKIVGVWLGWSLLFPPITIPLTFFGTGFYEYGWALKKPNCTVGED